MDDTEMDRRLAEWAATRSVVDRGAPVWELISYRFARWAMDLARADVAALGSVREAATWYAALEGAELTPDTVATRIAVLARIRRLLFGMITAARKRKGGSLFER